MVYNVTDCRTRGNTLMKEEKNMQDNVYDVLLERGLIAQTTHEQEIRELLGKEKVTFYIGFDPTADSLHVGHFLQMVVMRHMQNYGHRPIALVGGGTGHIGDPSGRTDMRQMMTKEIIDHNPFYKLQIKFREPIILPKTIPLQTIETLLNTIYKQYHNASSSYQKKNSLRDIAVIELLFATGIRISELCTIQPQNIDLQNAVIIIKGKGAKERLIHICDKHVITALDKYRSEYDTEIHSCGYFFVNSIGNRLSDQSVREMINKYCHIADIQQHITPHMFRHSFATLLLEEDVDLRYIQTMLGHSSINVTEIYTHVTMSKQKNILETKHPRKNMNISSQI